MTITLPLRAPKLPRVLLFIVLVFPGALLFLASPLGHAGSWIRQGMSFEIVRSSDPSCEPNCPEWIVAEGEVTETTPKDFESILFLAGKRKLPILINSEGGHVGAAMYIGEIIRKKKMTVEVARTMFPIVCNKYEIECKWKLSQPAVPGYASVHAAKCYSACLYILAGGVRRIVSEPARIGVHHPAYNVESFQYSYQMSENGELVLNKNDDIKFDSQDLDPEFNKLSKRYFKSMGINKGFHDFMLEFDFHIIHEMTKSEMNKYKIFGTYIRV